MIKTVAENNLFYSVVDKYMFKVAQEEIISDVAKKIRKMSRQMAEEIVANLDITLYIKPKDNTLGMTARKKIWKDVNSESIL